MQKKDLYICVKERLVHLCKRKIDTFVQKKDWSAKQRADVCYPVLAHRRRGFTIGPPIRKISVSTPPANLHCAPKTPSDNYYFIHAWNVEVAVRSVFFTRRTERHRIVPVSLKWQIYVVKRIQNLEELIKMVDLCAKKDMTPLLIFYRVFCVTR